jgi:hypothetical protein
MNINELIDEAAECLKLNKQLLLVIRGRRPKGFPIGELVCEIQQGVSNYYFDPIKVLIYCQKFKQEELND